MFFAACRDWLPFDDPRSRRRPHHQGANGLTNYLGFRFSAATSLGCQRLFQGVRQIDAGLDAYAILVPVMSTVRGFHYTTRKSGEVVVTHHGRQAAVLRGDSAARFLTKVTADNAQAPMARITGNYNRGNERRG